MNIYLIITETVAYFLLSCSSNDTAVTVAADKAPNGRDAVPFMSPDGKTKYSCGAERESAMGCFNTWTKRIHENKSSGWAPAYCNDQPDEYQNGYCFGGGVPWWWWKGSGRIGDPVLRDFWFRDYAGPEVNGVFRNDNSYGDARRLKGKLNCYMAKSTTFCMVPMK